MKTFVLVADGRYVSRIFYAEIPGGVGNVFAIVYRDGPESEPFQSMIRIRRYVDGDLTRKSKDEREGFTATAKPGASLEQLLRPIRRVCEAMGGGVFEEVIIDSDDPAVIIAKFKAQPWAHSEEIPIEDAS